MNGSVCQALNYNLTDTTIKGVIPILWDLRGQTATPRLDPAHAEITERIDPEAEFNLDEQCPAGYSWEEVNARFEALEATIKEAE
jgi:hypothetical protein